MGTEHLMAMPQQVSLMSDEIKDGTSSMRFFVPAGRRILVVEDDGDRIVWFKQRMPNAMFAETAEHAIRLLAAHKFNVVFLDHDLHWTHIADISIFKGTGREVAKLLQTMEFQGQVVIHSRNPIGAAIMGKYLPHAQVAPFGTFEIN
jgi:CheY-like chemotaxis protein